MKKNKSAFGFIIILLILNSPLDTFSQSKEKPNNENHISKLINTTINQDLLKSYKFIKKLKTRSGTILGDAYIKTLNDTIFYSMIIVKDLKVIYVINGLNFYNTKGVDFDIAKNQENFYGYQFRLIKEDHLVIGSYSNGGKNVGDDITLEWNSNSKIFEIAVAP